VYQLAATFHHRRFVLIGHDWGGAAAWEFAITHPECLSGLVIINAPHPALFVREIRRSPDQQEASRYINLFRSPIAERVLLANNFSLVWHRAFQALYEKGLMNDRDRKAYLTCWHQPGGLTGALNWYRAVPALDIPVEKSERNIDRAPTTLGRDLCVHVPTLVIWGLNDRRLLPGLLDGLDEYVQDLTIKRMPEAGHFVQVERSELVNSYIKDFLRSRKGSACGVRAI